METPDRIKKSLRIHSLRHPSGCIGCAYRGDNASKIPNGCADKLFKDVREYIKQLEVQVPRWISVKERLPEELKDVLVYRDGCFAIARIITGDDWTYCGMGGDPTHWMPLPEPPKEGTT